MAKEDVQKTLAELSRELQESKARLEEAQRVAHVGHWEWDLETDVVVWSDETHRIFGLSPQERPMDLATVQSMVHPDDREPLYRGVDQDLVAGERPIGEFRIVRPSGEVRTVSSLTSERWSSLPVTQKRTHPDDLIDCSAPFRTLLSGSIQRRLFRKFHASYKKATPGLKKLNALPMLIIILGTLSRIG